MREEKCYNVIREVECNCGTDLVVKRKKSTKTNNGLPGIVYCHKCGKWWEAYLPEEYKK